VDDFLEFDDPTPMSSRVGNHPEPHRFELPTIAMDRLDEPTDELGALVWPGAMAKWMTEQRFGL
jgi:hypothetical protein